MFKKLKGRVVYKNSWTTVYEDKIEFPDGSKGIYGFAERNDGALVIIATPKDEVLLINQYRYPIKNYEWGLPGGAMDSGEDPEECAKREVEEETGIKLSKVKKIAGFYPLSSLSTEITYLFFAKVDDVPEMKSSQHDESVKEKRFIPIKEVLEMVDRSEITDAFTGNALQIFARQLDR